MCSGTTCTSHNARVESDARNGLERDARGSLPHSALGDAE